MSNEAIYIRELPTLDFVMREINEQKTRTAATVNQKPGRLFYLLIVWQIAAMFGGAALALFVAPASLFVSRTEAESFAWIAAGLSGAGFVAFGFVSLIFAAFAVRGLHREKRYGKICGIVAAAAAIFQFPIGTIFGAYLILKLRGNKNGELK